MPTAVPTLTAAPASPDRADRATFSARAIALDNWQKNQNVPEMTAALANVYANALEAFNSAATATTKANLADADAIATAADRVQTGLDRTAASTSATNSETSRLGADKRYLGAKAVAPTLDNQGAALETGAVYYDTVLAKVRIWSGSAWVEGIASVAGVTSINALNGAVTLKTLGGNVLTGTGDIALGKLVRQGRTANSMLVIADSGSLIDITSGTFTQTFDAAATLGSGWYCYVRNKGGGAITLDPNASELIDGGLTLALGAGETRIVMCTGAAFETVVIPALVAPGAAGNVLTSSGTAWTSSAPVLPSALGIGAYSLAGIVPSSALAAGQSVSGSSLQISTFTYTPAVAGGAYLTGTWRAMTAIPSGQLGLFMRIA